MALGELRVAFFEVLDREGGDVSAAARAVGVSRNTAYGWVRKAGVSGRGKGGHPRHPRREEFHRLRASGKSRRAAAVEVGVHLRTAQDWESGWRKQGHVRVHDDGRRIDYNTGMSTILTAVSSPSLASVEADLHPRFLTVVEREMIADLRRQGESLREIGRQLGRSASTIKREIDARSRGGLYRPHSAQRAWTRSRSRSRPAGRWSFWRWWAWRPQPLGQLTCRQRAGALHVGCDAFGRDRFCIGVIDVRSARPPTTRRARDLAAPDSLASPFSEARRPTPAQGRPLPRGQWPSLCRSSF